jgi:hypothetical protein
MIAQISASIAALEELDRRQAQPLLLAAVAEAEKPPGTAPPVSGQWPVFDSQQKISPSRQTGMAKRTSIRCVPPR